MLIRNKFSKNQQLGCCVTRTYLAEVHPNHDVLDGDVREEALTFDLVLVESEGYSEMVSVPGEGDARGRGLQVLGWEENNFTNLQIYMLLSLYQTVLAINLRTLVWKTFTTQTSATNSFRFCNLNQQTYYQLGEKDYIGEKNILRFVCEIYTHQKTGDDITVSVWLSIFNVLVVDHCLPRAAVAVGERNFPKIQTRVSCGPANPGGIGRTTWKIIILPFLLRYFKSLWFILYVSSVKSLSKVLGSKEILYRRNTLICHQITNVLHYTRNTAFTSKTIHAIYHHANAYSSVYILRVHIIMSCILLCQESLIMYIPQGIWVLLSICQVDDRDVL